MKRYRDAIVVESGPDGGPVGFVWRDRDYRVVAVHGCWVEDVGWWRSDGGGRTGLWRVEARCPGGSDGVFELVSRDEVWELSRLWD